MDIVLKIIIKIIKRIQNFFDVLFLQLKLKLKKKVSVVNYQPEVEFFFHIDEKITSEFKQLVNDNLIKNEIVNSAKDILENRFSYFNLNRHKFDYRNIWNIDASSGYVWKNKFYKKIKDVKLNNNSDIKYPWELSRFHFASILGQAFLLTEKIEFYNKFKNLTIDWIQKNPINYGVNWVSSMDVSIRACNLILAYHFFENMIGEDNEFRDKIIQLLYAHGNHIFNNLENKTAVKNNHYLSNLVGLIWVGLFFDKYEINKDHKIWLDFGLRELEIELDKQFFDDGTNFEASTYYHCFVSEMVVYTYILLKLNKIKISENFSYTVKKMMLFINRLLYKNNQIPLIGDVDSGRFLLFSNARIYEHNFKHLLYIYNSFNQNSQFRLGVSNKNIKLDIFWITSRNTFHNFDQDNIQHMFKDSGYYFLDDSNISLVIRCGKNGTNGHGGHTHNDLLSIYVSYNGIPIFVDPGTYTYSSNYHMRNLFRSTKYHNTVQINKLEQNNFHKKAIFDLNEDADSKVLAYDYFEKKFIGEHSGYLKKIGKTHTRDLKINNERLYIIDEIFGEKVETLNTARFILNPKANINLEEHQIQIIINDYKFLLSCSDETNISVVDTYISTTYGCIDSSKCIEIVFDRKLKCKFELQRSE